MDVKDVSHQQNAGEQPTGGDKPQPTKTNETNNMVAIYHQTPDDLNAATESQAVVEAGNLQRIVILATARVRLQYGTDLSEPIRALMDAGGEISLITERCAKRLKLKMLSCHVPLKGVGGKAGILKKMVHVWLRPWFESDFVFPVFYTLLKHGRLSYRGLKWRGQTRLSTTDWQTKHITFQKWWNCCLAQRYGQKQSVLPYTGIAPGP